MSYVHLSFFWAVVWKRLKLLELDLVDLVEGSELMLVVLLEDFWKWRLLKRDVHVWELLISRGRSYLKYFSIVISKINAINWAKVKDLKIKDQLLKVLIKIAHKSLYQFTFVLIFIIIWKINSYSFKFNT